MEKATACSYVWMALLSASLAGCYSGLDLDTGGGDAADGGNVDTGGADGSGGANDGAGGGADETGGDDDGEEAEELPAPSARLYRLTHRQWENAVRDLLYLAEPTGLSEAFRADPITGGFLFDNNGQALEVDQPLWLGYQRAAASVAELVAAQPDVLAALLPPDGGDAQAQARTFVEEFGRRAFRRPLTQDEIETFASQFAAADSLYPESDAATSGVRLVLETMLQAPDFLYRIETSTQTDGDVIKLSDWEVASRLSFFLWDTTPDDSLLDLAEAGELSTAQGVREAAMRMLDDPGASELLRRFHNQLLEVDDVIGVSPSDMFFPDVDPQLGRYAVREVEMFVDDVFARGGGLAELLTWTDTFVNAELARIYGLEGTFDETFVRASLDPQERSGVFTRVQFLAGNATSVNPDPIHRGVFLVKHMTCTPLPPPPDEIPPVPPPLGKSNRQTVEAHTEAPGSSCAGCHSTFINPFGFPFEHYDAVGAFRVKDGEFDVDAASEVLLDGGRVPVANALELADAMAASPAVHKCYAKHLVEFSAGRPSVEEDDPLIKRLGASSLANGDSIKDLLLELVASQPFRTRSAQELP